MTNRRSIALAAVLAFCLLLGLVIVAQAQPGPRGGGPGGTGPGGPGMMGPGGPPMMGPGMMGPVGGGGPVMAATDQGVYVLAGHKIYKFDAGNLELLAEGELPLPQLLPRPEATAEAE